MAKFLLSILVFCLGSCVSTKKDAIEQQEDFIKIHPTWRDHDFGFDQKKNHLDANDISRAINEIKLQSKSDTIVKIKTD